jgi:hypothetical protein
VEICHFAFAPLLGKLVPWKQVPPKLLENPAGSDALPAMHRPIFAQPAGSDRGEDSP